MQRYSDIIVDPDGQVLDGATVAVYTESGSLATIYADAAGAFKANPFTVGTDTEYSFYAANGTYSVSTTLSGYHPKTLTGVLLYDPADEPIDASTMTFDDSADYPGGSVGDRVKSLVELAKTVEGTAGEIEISESGDTLTWALTCTTTNDDAATGKPGEYIETVVAKASAVSLTSGDTANVATISLTAGDWDVYGNVSFTGTATSVTVGYGAISAINATLPADENVASWLGRSAAMTADPGMALPMRRVSAAAQLTIYLVARGTFSGGTMTAYGAIKARRRR